MARFYWRNQNEPLRMSILIDENPDSIANMISADRQESANHIVKLEAKIERLRSRDAKEKA
jgi:hypothetical protein